MPRTGNTPSRGYGTHHQRLRAQLLPDAYGKACHFCGHPMLPGQPLDLDHSPDRQSYRGMAHASCNRRDGAAKTNAQTQHQPKNSRRW